MAILTAAELEDLRKTCATAITAAPAPINYSKANINLALQAIEDWWESAGVKAALSGAIDTATTPFAFTAAQKKRLAAYWLRQKFNREGV